MATISNVNFNLWVDDKDVQRCIKNIQLCAAIFPVAWQSIKPQFGAYMYYSKYLEEGTTKMFMRPHILPAVKVNLGDILKVLAEGCKKELDRIWYGMASPWNVSAVTREFKNAWKKALNGRVRQYAVDMAPYNYGFHRRSIRGYAEEPDWSVIEMARVKAYEKYGRKFQ
jgi:hypothetical protein